uniref:Uncharacterized protein n=1 Tax=Acrobeloides nanus TaxID=290746 RepID=A0A914EB42_9BILA
MKEEDITGFPVGRPWETTIFVLNYQRTNLCIDLRMDESIEMSIHDLNVSTRKRSGFTDVEPLNMTNA